MRTKGKRASYREGVAWIALNDEPGDMDPESVGHFISTLMLADLFGKPNTEVAADVIRYREKEGGQ